MKTTDHQATARALRDIASRIEGGFFRFINRERTIARLAREHAAALLALRMHHERMEAIHPRDYRMGRAAVVAGADEHLQVLHHASYFALKPLRRAEIEIAAKAGQCSPLDDYDLASGESVF